MRAGYQYCNIFWQVDGVDLVDQKGKELLGDYFKPSKEEHCDFEIRLVNENNEEKFEIVRYGRLIVIHNSKKPEVHEEGRCLDNGLTRLIYNLTTKSVYHINYLNNKITIYNKDLSALSKDYIRVTRDIVKLYVQKKHGIMLHAATVKKGDKGIVFVGSKGCGKTTLSLNLIYQYGYEEVSRDRTFIIKEPGGLMAYGWPNYYNLTYRTISSFEDTKMLLPGKYVGLNPDELDAINEKKQFIASEINITKKATRVLVDRIVFLKNLNIGGDKTVDEILSESAYTPFDLNYPDWYSQIPVNASDYEKTIELYQNLSKIPNNKLVEWKQIDDAVKQLVVEV